MASQKPRSTMTCQLGYWALLPLMILTNVTIGDAEVWARARDLVATPGLMDSPVQRFESRMREAPLQRNESRMRESPTQRIGSPFGPYRFATLPNLQELRATRRSIPALPAMMEIPQGTLLLLPTYTVPQTMETIITPPVIATATQATTPSQPQPATQPKFMSQRCGKFVTLAISQSANLAEVEGKPCD